MRYIKNRNVYGVVAISSIIAILCTVTGSIVGYFYGYDAATKAGEESIDREIAAMAVIEDCIVDGRRHELSWPSSGMVGRIASRHRIALARNNQDKKQVAIYSGVNLSSMLILQDLDGALLLTRNHEYDREKMARTNNGDITDYD